MLGVVGGVSGGLVDRTRPHLFEHHSPEQVDDAVVLRLEEVPSQLLDKESLCADERFHDPNQVNAGLRRVENGRMQLRQLGQQALDDRVLILVSKVERHTGTRAREAGL